MGNCDPYSDSPKPWSSTTRVYSGLRSRRCYAIMWTELAEHIVKYKSGGQPI